jgi:CubicO group peptidase (beta-lactamase class C family)
MNRRMLPLIIGFCLTSVGLALTARGASDIVVLGEGNAFWSNNLNAPVCKAMLKAQRDHQFHRVSFTATGDWVILSTGKPLVANNPEVPAFKKLAEFDPTGAANDQCVAFAPTGGWMLLWGGNGNWTVGSVPPDAFTRLQEVIKGGASPRAMSFGPNGAWVLLYDQAGVAFGNIPDDLTKVLNEANQNHVTVRCICFTPSGAWICLTSGGWFTSDLNHPASKLIAQLEAQHKSLEWVAVGPDIGPHDFKKWSAIVHEHCDGKLPAGYAFEVLQKGEVVAQEAHGWARAPWEKDHPSVEWTLDKPMGIASVSKTITAVALLRLWQEKGRTFSLDAPFWPHIKTLCPDVSPDVKTVTIRQLLQHKSGFKKGVDVTSPADLEKLLKQPLAFPAGTHEEYDNNNFYIARLVLEQIGHVQYTPYVKQHVLSPMGITQMETHFQAEQPTCGYGKPGTTRPGFPFDWKCEATAGAAGWYGSITDLGRFLAGLRSHKVLSVATTDMMYKDLLGWDTSDPGWEKNGGWFWDEGSGTGSRAGAFRSSIYHFPDDVDAVMFINSDAPEPPEAILQQAWLASMQR